MTAPNDLKKPKSKSRRSKTTTPRKKKATRATPSAKKASSGGHAAAKTTKVAKKATSKKTASKRSGPVVDSQLSRDQREFVYRTMFTSRRLDDVEIGMKRLNQIYFQISGAGHEATLVAATLHLKAGHDWFFPYYRDRALCLGLGVTPLSMLLQGVGAAADPASGGRQMPSHWGSAEHNIPSQSSSTGTQFLNAVGCAEAGVRAQTLSAATQRQLVFERDEVVYVSCGDGTTSEGEFYEALNTSCNLRLPVIFHVEDNGYAISVPIEVQTAGGSISGLVSGYPNLKVIEFDGCCPEASSIAWREAVDYTRERQGPVLLHSHVVRPYSHSMSDDERNYRLEDERADEAKRDPVETYRRRLTDEFGFSVEEIEGLEAEVERSLSAAKDQALASPPPAPEQSLEFVYSPDVDPCGESFAREPAPVDEQGKTMVDLINACLREEMHRDERIVVFGEDVADASREEVLPRVKGKGGVFKVTAGLQREFGGERVFNSPLAEANILGRAVGMAMRGLKPVVEIQFFDYIWPAMMQMRSELALLRWRSNNAFQCPVVVRSTYGGYLKGGAVYHSQTGESIFAHIPGLRVVLPSNALDANGLLRTAIRCEDPVIFLEHKHLYRQTYNRAPNPGPDFTIPFGKAARVREGQHLTVITYGALVKRSLDAAQRAAKEDGLSVEVLDLRTVSPYDWEAIAESVKKTGKALVVYEDALSWGSGAEIAARIADELFDDLDGPVRRLASTDTFVAYHPTLEDFILPQTEDVLSAVRALAAY
ncbi:MAG: thiamine pyrophosphate-dependent enzyme [Myxococcota bacterium]